MAKSAGAANQTPSLTMKKMALESATWAASVMSSSHAVRSYTFLIIIPSKHIVHPARLFDSPLREMSRPHIHDGKTRFTSNVHDPSCPISPYEVCELMSNTKVCLCHQPTSFVYCFVFCWRRVLSLLRMRAQSMFLSLLRSSFFLPLQPSERSTPFYAPSDWCPAPPAGDEITLLSLSFPPQSMENVSSRDYS